MLHNFFVKTLLLAKNTNTHSMLIILFCYGPTLENFFSFVELPDRN